MRSRRVLVTSAAAAVTAAVTSAAIAHTTGYNGSGDRVNFTVMLDRHARTSDYEVTWEVPCNQPNTQENDAFGTSSTPGERPLPVARSGRFRLHRHFRNPWGSVYDIHFSGRLARLTAAGTFSATITSETHNRTVSCVTGTVHWRAQRQ